MSNNIKKENISFYFYSFFIKVIIQYTKGNIRIIYCMLCFHCSFRQLKKLKQKNPKQISLEKKEQGFSLYVSGANDKYTDKKNKQQHYQSKLKKSTTPSTKRSKTARGGSCQHVHMCCEHSYRDATECV